MAFTLQNERMAAGENLRLRNGIRQSEFPLDRRGCLSDTEENLIPEAIILLADAPRCASADEHDLFAGRLLDREFSSNPNYG
jgi:hypothetical protein